MPLAADAPTRPDALLLDLGGVVIDIDGARVFDRWATQSGTPIEVIRERWASDDGHHRFERSEIDEATYFAGVRAALAVELSDDQLIEGWNRIFVGLFPGVVELLQELAARVPIFGLTNTNPTHHTFWSAQLAPQIDAFTTVFASSELGQRKPDPAIFTHVAEQIGVPIDRIHFFDDAAVNVEGALAAGMPATQVTSFDQFAASARSLVIR